MKERIEKLLSLYDATLIDFQYYKKIFGNIIVKIKYRGVIHEFIVDRGEISHNEKMICDNTYHIAGKDDAFDKLCECIVKELFD